MASVFTLEGPRLDSWWQRVFNRTQKAQPMTNLSYSLGTPYPTGMSLLGMPGLGAVTMGGVFTLAASVAAGAALGAGGLWAYKKYRRGRGLAGASGRRRRRR